MEKKLSEYIALAKKIEPKNTENTRAKAVSACSPPDSRDNFCNFFPGGDTINSKPE